MILPGMKEGESLDKFHDRCINLSKTEKDSKSKAIDQFVRFLHKQKFLDYHSVAEVIKGGSLGKGTAVKERSDVDLVVFLNGFSGMDDFKLKRCEILSNLKHKATQYHGGDLRVFQVTPYSLRCMFNGEDMDILPAIHITSLFWLWPLSRVYSTIAASSNVENEAQNFSAALTTYQISFVSQVPETVKRVIRLVKYWKHATGVWMPSYAVELVTIYASRQGCSNTQQLFEAVMNLLQHAESLQIAFDDNYSSGSFTHRFHGPYVLDPANPFKNTLSGTNTLQVSRRAQETLEGCKSSSWWCLLQ